MKKINIGIFADGPWSHLTIIKLKKNKRVRISFICGRYKTEDKELKKISKKFNIDFLKIKKINSKNTLNNLRRYKCDLFVSMSYNQIFGNGFLKIPHLGTINCHAGKLPFYRGRSVLNWVLINGEKEFGITVHYVDTKIDTGDIILQKTYKIYSNDNYMSLLKKSYRRCCLILNQAINMIINNRAERIPQKLIDKKGSYFRKRKDGDEVINWNDKSENIHNFIRGLSFPGPIAQSHIGRKKIFIFSSRLIHVHKKFKKLNVGQIISLKNNSLNVVTQDNIIKITKWKYDGKVKVGDMLGK